MQSGFSWIDIIFLILLGAIVYTRFFSKKLPKDDKKNPSGLHVVKEQPHPLTEFNQKEKAAPKKRSLEGLEGLDKIRAFDTSFKEKEFIKGAEAAFETFHQAYNTNDQDLLESLASPRLFDEVMDEIETEHEKGNYPKKEIKKIKSVQIMDGRVSGRTVIIDVKYEATIQEYKATKQGSLKKGQSKKDKEVQTVWTWARSVDSDDPNWELEEINTVS